ncbi:MAG: CbiX/SirB N-terminal domain-containing protein [Coriobacteriia bacterium]|nr:CbiX/SirB N-terminal domain-containing protein [Coriobacteriia bacterium]
MECVLVVAHGSRARETEDAFDAVIDMVRELLPETHIVSTYMQLSDRTLEQTVAELVRDGVSDIRIVPYFLFTGVHIKQDIPEMIKRFGEKYPAINIDLGQPLGVDRRLAEIVVDRIRQI